MSPRGRHPRAAAAPAPARIELRIDELVLHGVALRDRHRVADAIERELARLVADGGAPAAAALATNPAPARPAPPPPPASIVVPRGARAEDLGAGVARAIYRTLGPTLGAAPGPDREGGA